MRKSFETLTATAAALLGVLACAEPVADYDANSKAETPAPAAVGIVSDEQGWDELVPNPQRPAAGVLSGGQPTPGQLAAASAAGFRTVINLRRDGEPGSEGEAALVAELGMGYVHLPIPGADGMTEDNARALAAALEAAEKPVLLHCGSGNRVGGLFALEAFYLEGADIDAALERGLATGLTGLEPVVRERLESAAAARAEG